MMRKGFSRSHVSNIVNIHVKGTGFLHAFLFMIRCSKLNARRPSQSLKMQREGLVKDATFAEDHEGKRGYFGVECASRKKQLSRIHNVVGIKSCFQCPHQSNRFGTKLFRQHLYFSPSDSVFTGASASQRNR